MKRSELEKFLGKNVEVTIFDGDTYRGVLHKSGENMFKDDLNLYLPKKYYFVTDECGIFCRSCLFRCSHVNKIRPLGGENK